MKNVFPHTLITKVGYCIIQKSSKLIATTLKNAFSNEIQISTPVYKNLQYHGCNSITQVAVYSIGTKVGLSIKILSIILLFLGKM